MTMRSVDTRFWSDGWVRKLNALDRYLFLYLLTNDHTNWCGIYELDIGMLAFETGIDERDLERSMLPRLAPKILYIDGWVYIQNYSKYHLNGTEATRKGYERAFNAVPEKIRRIIKELDTEGVVPPSHPSSAFAFTSALTPEAPSASAFVVVKETESERPSKESKSAIDQYEKLCRWAEERRGFKFVNRAKQYAALKKAKDLGITPHRLKERWAEMEGESWREGFDLTTCVSSFDKRA